MGFNNFDTQKIAGKRNIDPMKYLQLLAEVKTMNDNFFEEVLPKPKK